MGPITNLLNMDCARRKFLANIGMASLLAPALARQAWGQVAPVAGAGPVFDVRAFGAIGDGKSINSPAINRAIQTASLKGGVVYVPAGSYACYSLRLASSIVALHRGRAPPLWQPTRPARALSQAMTRQRAMRLGGLSGFRPQSLAQQLDLGREHPRRRHSRARADLGTRTEPGHDDADLPVAEAPGVGNKAIALKNCHNVILRDFSMLACGHFAILATGVDNLTIDNLKIDTNRDGINIDCCRNVRVSNCSVNSPWDDAICPKSSFALGYARVTENVTIANCYVTGGYQVGSLLDGSFKTLPDAGEDHGWQRTGRIKCGTESNGGFRNIAISNCIFESCRGLALETVDGGIIEDITVVGTTMRDIRNAPLFLRLGARMRGPKDIPIGSLKRVLISNVTCYAPSNDMPSILSGIPDPPDRGHQDRRVLLRPQRRRGRRDGRVAAGRAAG